MKPILIKLMGILLILASIVLLLFSLEDTIKVKYYEGHQTEIIKQLKEQVVESKPKLDEEDDEAKLDEPAKLVRDSQVYPIKETILDRGNGPAIGAISIPSVGINLPILKGVGETNLLTGAGTNKENQVMGQGNYTLASHYIYDGKSLFSPLRNLQEGDVIYITDFDKVHLYVYTTVYEHQPEDVYVLDDDGSNQLTMYTCTNDWLRREVYQADYRGYYNYHELTDSQKQEFQIS